ncbi:putative nuclease HARBI1 [Xenia sp. Carnegie-2017]|uniref:putative nuclease HARBI1 n=1 Tax=Xenia sp. Carnegie-2017 TaxID=2897299 RepID=UPI001F0331FC|nr:putative nuclease HARBI1 [Xenia sp. Carnegie-2017]
MVCLMAAVSIVMFHHNKAESSRRLQGHRALVLHVTKVFCKTRSLIHNIIESKHHNRCGRVWAFPRMKNILDSEFTGLSEKRWLESYRLPKRLFLQLVNSMRLLGRQSTRLRPAIPVNIIVAMMLKRLGKGLDYREIGDKFGVGASTACTKVNEALRFLIRTKKYMLNRLQERRNLKEIVDGFAKKWNIPQCLGAVDGTHIPIRAPVMHHADYFNRKFFHSVILQAVCDSECHFTDIFVGWPGNSHDARVFSCSNIGQRTINGNLIEGGTLTKQINGKNIEPFLIGDPAYPLLKHLMKNYAGANLGHEKEYFNYRLNRARIQIERAFGLLKGRWRCLLHPLECDIEKVSLHVTAACILHNICQEGNAEYLQEWDDRNNDDLDYHSESNSTREENETVENAEDIRKVLTQYVSHY